MNNIKLISDSTCDLSQEIIEKYDISIVPLYVTFDKDSYRDGVDIDTKKLYKTVKERDILPKTSSPTPSDFYKEFKKYVDLEKDIIYIGLSSEISSTIQNAKIAADQFENSNIYIIDSKNLSAGIGLLLLKANDYINEGLSTEEIVKKINRDIDKVRTSFIVDTFDYLHKGGRCNTIQSFIGGMFKIKPIIKVVDGKIIVGQKPRGKKKKALKVIINNIIKNKESIDLSRIIIGDSMSYQDSLFFKNELQKNVSFDETIFINAGCVISSHCGENTTGVYYMNK